MNIEAFNQELTPAILRDCLIATTEGLKLKKPPTVIEKAVEDFFRNQDHGHAHSLGVYEKSLEILERSPNVKRNATRSFSTEEIRHLLFAGAVFHDLARFFGYYTWEHELAGAELARSVFACTHGQTLYEMIVKHDYFSPLTDTDAMPVEVLSEPLPEILRLADKTSISPEQEVDRWWECGQRYGTPFFNPELTDEVRFDLKRNNAQRDQLTHFLLLFALQPSDFYSYEASSYYGLWAQGKEGVVAKILKLAGEQGYEKAEISGILRRFHEYYNLAVPQEL